MLIAVISNEEEFIKFAEKHKLSYNGDYSRYATTKDAGDIYLLVTMPVDMLGREFDRKYITKSGNQTLYRLVDKYMKVHPRMQQYHNQCVTCKYDSDFCSYSCKECSHTANGGQCACLASVIWNEKGCEFYEKKKK